MTPPEATQAGHSADAGEPQSAVFLCPTQTLRNRADFLRANRGRRQVMPGFILLARKRYPAEGPQDMIRVGFTCSKKLGNAVRRNRAKRRLREIARMTLPGKGHAGWDYVLIGRPDNTAARPFAALASDLQTALGRIHKIRTDL